MFVREQHRLIYTASVMATYFIVMYDKNKSAICKCKVIQDIVRNMIDIDEESKTDVSG